MDSFKEENLDLIIVDTRSHHKQENAIFSETRRVSEVVVYKYCLLILNAAILFSSV